MFVFSENCSVLRFSPSLQYIACMHVWVSVRVCFVYSCVRFDVSASASGVKGSHFLRVLRVPFSNTLLLVDLVCLFSSDLNKRIFFRLSFPFPGATVKRWKPTPSWLFLFCSCVVVVEWTTNSSLKVGCFCAAIDSSRLPYCVLLVLFTKCHLLSF